jgi:hypothetical protein
MLTGSLHCIFSNVYQPQEKYKGIVDDAADAQKFLRLFSGIISFSTPHLYLSALPFSPKNSAYFEDVCGQISLFCKDNFWPQWNMVGDAGRATWSL